ncbi:MAG: ferritin-like domain-containing protein [Polyangiaceae bacterium]|nr:ferritin-like domain-containing protein [Polyangiaceae bacterium]
MSGPPARSFVVDGSVGSGTLGGPDGWASLRALDAGALDPALRARLAEEWSRDALFEHASVGSFDRFSLHLLAVAAPPSLIEDAHQAAIDEILHARLCFALASAYAGEPLGPGRLPLEGDVLGRLDLPSIAAAAVTEGCVGETLASLEAATALERATVPAVREALQQIADDEARHAELAWRFVRWALDLGDPDARVAVERAFREALDAQRPPLPEEDPLVEGLAAHGRLSLRQKRLSFDEGLVEVVAPAARALLG